MTAPDQKHTDALADLIAEERDKYPRLATDMDSEELAAAILDSSDPVVHAAMLDALTRHGVLTEVWRWRNENVGGLYGCPPVSCEATSRAHLTEYEDDTIERRLVTPWEVTP